MNKIKPLRRLCFQLFILLPLLPLLTYAQELKIAATRNLSGSVADLLIEGTVLYTGGSSGLRLFNITDPENPTEISTLGFSTAVKSLALKWPYLYVGTVTAPSAAEFYVLNLTNLQSPQIVAALEIGSTVAAIAPHGNLAYLGISTGSPTGSEVMVVNLANPLQPTITGTANPLSSVFDLVINADRLYITRENNQGVFSIFSLDSPSNPIELGKLAIGKAVRSYQLAVYGTHAFLVNYPSDGLDDFSVIDISNPALPKRIRRVDLPIRAFSLALANGFAFVGTDDGSAINEFQVIDIIPPQYAKVVDSLKIGSEVHSIAIAGNYAYLGTNSGSAGLRIINLGRFITPDNVPPQITLAQPENGLPLSGTVKIEAQASDNVSIKSVQFLLNGNAISPEIHDPPYQYNWDSSLSADGSFSLTARAVDHSGNSVISMARTVQVNNSGPDLIPPTVTIVTPQDATLVAKTILLTADASDNRALDKVQFRINGVNYGVSVKAAPYSVALDTSELADGDWTIDAVATDQQGLTTVSQSIKITVNNQAVQNSWRNNFSALRQRYISPSGGGDGSSASSTLDLASAITSAQPGDLFWLTAGSYSAGRIALTRAGTAANPIVWRAMPDQRVTIIGCFQVSAANNWIWGLEITDPDNTASDCAGINMLSSGIRAINNVVHNQYNKNGIGAWNTGSGQVVYGNILFENGRGTNHPHNIYTQNRFSDYGYKYIIGNMLLDSSLVCGNCFNLHAYTEGGFISGFYLEKNITRRGRFLIGGYNHPADRQYVADNYFYQSGPQFGYARPAQAEFRRNYIGRGSLNLAWFWGAGETVFLQSAPNVFTDNQVYGSGSLVSLRTSAYLESGRSEGGPSLHPADIMDNNRYSQPFSAGLNAAGTSSSYNQLTNWQSATATAGNRFESNSEVVPLPTTPKVFVIPNEYEAARAHLAIYNWGLAATISLNLEDILASGSLYTIRSARDPYGPALKQGQYQGGLIELTTEGEEFLALLLTSKADSTRPAPPQRLRKL